MYNTPAYVIVLREHVDAGQGLEIRPSPSPRDSPAVSHYQTMIK